LAYIHASEVLGDKNDMDNAERLNQNEWDCAYDETVCYCYSSSLLIVIVNIVKISLLKIVTGLRRWFVVDRLSKYLLILEVI
jgi:hypothetical protein